MRWEQRKTQGEIRAWEDSESLDEDVGDGLVACEMGIELVTV